MDVSVVNRIVSGAMGLKLEHLEKFLTAIGLRVVDLDATTVDRDELDALRALALRYLNKEASNG